MAALGLVIFSVLALLAAVTAYNTGLPMEACTLLAISAIFFSAAAVVGEIAALRRKILKLTDPSIIKGHDNKAAFNRKTIVSPFLDQ